MQRLCGPLLQQHRGHRGVLAPGPGRRGHRPDRAARLDRLQASARAALAAASLGRGGRAGPGAGGPGRAHRREEPGRGAGRGPPGAGDGADRARALDLRALARRDRGGRQRCAGRGPCPTRPAGPRPEALCRRRGGAAAVRDRRRRLRRRDRGGGGQRQRAQHRGRPHGLRRGVPRLPQPGGRALRREPSQRHPPDPPRVRLCRDAGDPADCSAWRSTAARARGCWPSRGCCWRPRFCWGC